MTVILALPARLVHAVKRVVQDFQESKEALDQR